MAERIDQKENLINLYLEEQIAIARSFPAEDISSLIERVIAVYEREKAVYVCGNGGNAAFAENLTNDWRFLPFVSDDKTRPLVSSVKRLRVVNLAASPATMTGILNDFGGEHIFSAQLEGIVQPDDLVIGFSGSGNSANILRVFEVAKASGASTVGIARGNGGKLKSASDLCIIIPGSSKFPGQIGGNNNNFHFEDCLSSIAHIVSGALQQYVRNKNS